MISNKAMLFSSAAVFTFAAMAMPLNDITAYADGNMTISADSVSVTAGEKFEAGINLSNIPSDGISGIEFAVKYDPSLITVDSVSGGKIIDDSSESQAVFGFSSVINTDASCVNIMWVTSTDSYIKDDGVFAVISGTAAGGVSGTAELEIIPVPRGSGKNKIYASVGYDAELVTPSVKNGSVTVKASSSSSEPPQTDAPSDTLKPSMLGDANCDGRIDVLDATTIIQSILQLHEMSELEYLNSDVVADGIIDVKDLGQLKKYMIKLIDSF